MNTFTCSIDCLACDSSLVHRRMVLTNCTGFLRRAEEAWQHYSGHSFARLRPSPTAHTILPSNVFHACADGRPIHQHSVLPSFNHRDRLLHPQPKLIWMQIDANHLAQDKAIRKLLEEKCQLSLSGSDLSCHPSHLDPSPPFVLESQRKGWDDRLARRLPAVSLGAQG